MTYATTGLIPFFGEGPGKTEDQTGRPYVGSAGRHLDRIMIKVVGSEGALYYQYR